MAYKNHKDYLKKQQEIYKRNKKQYLQRNIKRRQELKEFVDSFKNKPCLDCGQTFPNFVMEFDHKENHKDFNISVAYKRGYGKKRIREEISKCDLICSNCHRIRHYGIV